MTWSLFVELEDQKTWNGRWDISRCDPFLTLHSVHTWLLSLLECKAYAKFQTSQPKNTSFIKSSFNFLTVLECRYVEMAELGKNVERHWNGHIYFCWHTHIFWKIRTGRRKSMEVYFRVTFLLLFFTTAWWKRVFRSTIPWNSDTPCFHHAVVKSIVRTTAITALWISSLFFCSRGIFGQKNAGRKERCDALANGLVQKYFRPRFALSLVSDYIIFLASFRILSFLTESSHWK